MMKKYLAVLTLAVAITGCSGGNRTQSETTVLQAEKEKTGPQSGGLKTERPGEGEAGAAAVQEGTGSKGMAPKPGMPLQKGNKAPDFTANLADGTTLTLSDFQGKPVIINFWATWCGPCVREMPAFERLKEEFGEDIGVITVNCGDDEETIRSFMEKNGYTFPVVLDEDYGVSMLYPTNGIPYTVILDEEGNVTHISTGAANADKMYEAYKEALGL